MAIAAAADKPGIAPTTIPTTAPKKTNINAEVLENKYSNPFKISIRSSQC